MKRREALALGALTLFALGLRLFRLGYFELWTDEGATWFFARWMMGTEMGAEIALEATPPLYYGLVGIMMWLFGDSDIVLRLPSALFGAAAVPALYVLGRRLAGSRVGGVAAFLLAVHPLHLWYSREARVYPLLVFLTILWLGELARALERGTPGAWARCAGVLLLTCAFHLTGLFLGLASGILVLALAPDARTRRRGIVALALVGLCAAPYIAWILPQLGPSGAAWLSELYYEAEPEEATLGRMLEQQLIGARYTFHVRQLDRPPTPLLPRFAALVSQAILLLAAVFFGLRAGHQRALLLVLGAWFVPVVTMWGLNTAWKAVFQAGRHDVYTLGAVCLLLALGFEGLLVRRRFLAVAFLACVLTASVGLRLSWLHQQPPGEFNQRVGAWISQHLDVEDQVIAMGLRRPLAERYARLVGSSVRFSSFPASTDNHPGWSDVPTLAQDPEALRREARALVPELWGERVCLLLRPRDAMTWQVDRHLLEALAEGGWRMVDQRADLRLLLLERPGLEREAG